MISNVTNLDWVGHSLQSEGAHSLLQRFYKQNIVHSSSCLTYLLPEQRDSVNKLRRANKYELFLARTELSGIVTLVFHTVCQNFVSRPNAGVVLARVLCLSCYCMF